MGERIGPEEFYNVTFARTSTDDTKAYHDTVSVGRDDLPCIAKLADQAHTFIFGLPAKRRRQPST